MLRDTGAGCDKIENWPDIGFIDWALEALYLFNSLGLSLLPGVALAWWWGRSGELPADMIFAPSAAAAFLLFPVILLSMLEKNSLVAVISPAVCRTFWMATNGWLTFYFMTAMLLAAAGIVVLTIFAADSRYGLIAAAVALSLVWLIYFRLLGRLAWYCTDRSAVAEPDDQWPGEDPGSETPPVSGGPERG